MSYQFGWLYHKLINGWLIKARNLVLTILQIGNPRSRYKQAFEVQWGSHFLVQRWYHINDGSFLVFLLKRIHHITRAHPITNIFYGPASKYYHPGCLWLWHLNFEDMNIQIMAARPYYSLFQKGWIMDWMFVSSPNSYVKALTFMTILKVRI